MANPIKVNCDSCGAGFQVHYQSEILPGGVEKLYFDCPGCKRRYVVSYTDGECRKLQRKIGRYQLELGDKMDALKRKYTQLEPPEQTSE